jgi:hypothetical protein
VLPFLHVEGRHVVRLARSWASPVAALSSAERGQDLVEYAILSSAIGMVAFVAWFTFFGGGDVFAGFVGTLHACLTFDAEACTAE